MGRPKRLLFLAAGIFVSFLLFGLIQEKVVKTPYVNSDGTVEYFTYSMSLVCVYCVVNYILSSILCRILKEEDSVPNIYYYGIALLYFLAMACTTMALQFVSYPTQVVAKSCKPIPVMILGVLLGRKSYSFKKYVFVFMVVIGVSLFLYKDKKEDKPDVKNDSFLGLGIGEFLLFCSLFMDGLYAAMQEKIKADHTARPLAVMGQMNKWATVYIVICLFLTKEVFRFATFVQKQPNVLWKLGALSLCGFSGQFFVISTVLEFGTLPATIITTVRKFFTVLASVLILGNELLPRQWLGTVIIFSGLILDVLYGKTETKSK